MTGERRRSFATFADLGWVQLEADPRQRIGASGAALRSEIRREQWSNASRP